VHVGFFFDSERDRRARDVRASCVQSDIAVRAFRVGRKWEQLSSEELSMTMSDLVHIVLFLSPRAVRSRWTSFIAGYAMGADRAISVFVDDEHDPVPPYLTAFPCFSRVPDLVRHITRDLDDWLTAQIVHTARDELIEMGLSITADSFADSVAQGDVRAVESFLRAGFSPNTRDSFGVPLVNLAVRNGRQEVLRLLVERGADVNQQSNDRGNTALMEAAGRGDIRAVRILIERGAELEQKSKNGQTALMLAVAEGFVEAGRILLAYGADPFVQDSLGMSASKYAELFRQQALLGEIRAVESAETDLSSQGAQSQETHTDEEVDRTDPDLAESSVS